MKRGALTGRTRFRTGWFGRQILQVEVELTGWQVQSNHNPSGPPLRRMVSREWRDARCCDVVALKITVGETA